MGTLGSLVVWLEGVSLLPPPSVWNAKEYENSVGLATRQAHPDPVILAEFSVRDHNAVCIKSVDICSCTAPREIGQH